MSVPVPPAIVRNDAGEIISIINRDPKKVDPSKCVHFPESGPTICMCVHDASIAGAVGERNAVTGADGPWGPVPRKKVAQRYLPR